MLTFITFNSKIISIVSYTWSKGVLLALKMICNLSYEIEGLHNLPDKPFIIASKHQSVWETIFYLSLFKNPVFILKKELTRIPIYGWYLPLLGMVIIDRKKGINSLTQIKEGVRKAYQENRIIVIFPEGTRVPHNQTVPFKGGIAAINEAVPELPIVPIALNSGISWPKNSWLIRPGIVKVSILKSLEGKYSKQDLLPKLKNIIDDETKKLL